MPKGLSQDLMTLMPGDESYCWPHHHSFHVERLSTASLRRQMVGMTGSGRTRRRRLQQTDLCRLDGCRCELILKYPRGASAAYQSDDYITISGWWRRIAGRGANGEVEGGPAFGMGAKPVIPTPKHGADDEDDAAPAKNGARNPGRGFALSSPEQQR